MTDEDLISVVHSVTQARRGRPQGQPHAPRFVARDCVMHECAGQHLGR